MYLKQITDASLAQNAYLIGCQRTGEAIVVDPERDVDRYLELAEAEGLRIVAVADTHIHADYLSGVREFVEHHGAKAYVTAEGGPDWQMEWAKGDSRTREIRNGDSIKIGNIELTVLLTPGHTPEHVSFLLTDHGGGASEPIAILSGDFIFVGDVGRPDLLESAAGQAGAMEASAKVLYDSLRQTEGLPDFLQVLPAHGAGSACGKALGAIPTSVLGYERKFNGALHEALTESREDFVDSILSGQPEPPVYFARMKRDNRDGQALLPDGKLPQPEWMAATDFAAFVADDKNVVLDLRTDKPAFMAKHVKGSLWAPLQGTEFPEMAGSFVEEKTPIVLLVNKAGEVEEAVRQLVRIGYDEVVGWLPVEEALASSVPTESIERITTAELPESLSAKPGFVLDVRRAAEFAEGHFEGAKQIAHTRLMTRTEELPKDEVIYVHCRSGARAAKAASFLAKKGFDVVHVDGAVEALLGQTTCCA
ncbi:MAG: MBL fold metallo-hydrolase [Roseibacillus sp.]